VDQTSLREADERVELGGSDVAPAWSDRRPAGRITELDAVRGFAAVTVVVGHSLTVFPNFDDVTRGERGLALVNAVKYSPLALVQSGDAAVILFFSSAASCSRCRSWERVRPPIRDSSPSASVASTCPIWPPLRLPSRARRSSATRPSRAQPVGQCTVAGRLRRRRARRPRDDAGQLHNAQYDPVLWSLVHEMRISLVFPLLVLAVLVLGCGAAS